MKLHKAYLNAMLYNTPVLL